MKIGIDIQAARGRATGLGVYTRALTDSLLRVQGNGFEIDLLEKEQRSEWNTLERLYWENVELPLQIRRKRIQLLHTPAFSPPLVKPCRLVVTVHDLIGMIYANQLGRPSRFYWGKWLPRAVKGADALIADSEHTRKDLVERLHVPSAKIHVIYPSGHEPFSPETDPARQAEVRERLGIRGRYFLTVGTLEPRKNFDRTAEAFSDFLRNRTENGDYQLVAVGSKEFAHGRYFEGLLKKWENIARSVVWTGYLDQKDLNLLYSGAAAFLFPSLYEGFGIPVLEAMASGTPVITSKTSSLPEVAGSAAWLVDPEDSHALSEAMKAFTESERRRQEFIQKGFERIRHFSWQETAKKTLKVYEAVGRN